MVLPNSERRFQVSILRDGRMITTCEFHNLIGMFAIIRLFSKPKRGLGYAKENRRNLFCNQRRNLLGFDGCRSASADGRFRLYSRRSGRRPASGCRSAAADVRAFLHAPITSEVFFSTRRSKRHSALRSARPAHPTDVFLSDSVQQRRHRRHPRGHYSGIHDDLGYLCKASRTSDS